MQGEQKPVFESVTDFINSNAKETAKTVERTHAKKVEVCAVCSSTISEEDFAAGRDEFTESRASGRVYLCRKCAGSK